MKKIAVGIISVGLCTALLATGIKTASNAFADEAGSEKIETVTLDVDSLEKNGSRALPLDIGSSLRIPLEQIHVCASEAYRA